jgi:hypothetical protein
VGDIKNWSSTQKKFNYQIKVDKTPIKMITASQPHSASREMRTRNYYGFSHAQGTPSNVL